MKVAVFPGSFDPVTKGHVDLIRRAARLCDRLIVAVLHNPDKQAHFTPEERIALLRKALQDVPNLAFQSFSGLLADFARAEGASFLVRGLRNEQDLSYEAQMAWANAQLMPGLETVFLQAQPALAVVSSSLVRQIAAFGGDIRPYVPACAVDEIIERFYNKHSGATKGGTDNGKK